jgi:hypothetical protein
VLLEGRKPLTEIVLTPELATQILFRLLLLASGGKHYSHIPVERPEPTPPLFSLPYSLTYLLHGDTATLTVTGLSAVGASRTCSCRSS